MSIRCAINGLGRVGRLVLRQARKNPYLDIVAVNDVAPADHLAYLLKYDSTHGPFPVEIEARARALFLDGKEIAVHAEKDPSLLPWKEEGIDFVVEATGHFTQPEDAAKHLQAGAKRVLITAPAKKSPQHPVPTYVMGVNHTDYNPQKDRVVSNASCTTNCLAILCSVLCEHYGIEEGLMTTVHAVTASQPLLDAPARKDWRGGRSALQNIIPASTGAAKALEACLPQLKGKLTGMAFRVPVADVSVIDLVVRLTRPAPYAEICQTVRRAAEGKLKGLLAYCDEEVVSSDFKSTIYSCVFDARAGIALTEQFVKLIAWYDNEWGYAARVVDLLEYMAKKEQKVEM